MPKLLTQGVSLEPKNGRQLIGIVAGFKSERWPVIDRNAGRLQLGIRSFALGRKSWLFAGSDRSADRAAFMATLIMTAKLNDIDPQAWLADVLANIADTPISRLQQLLPWNWTPKTLSAQAA